MKNNNNEIRSSAHSKYRCQYHIVFAPKYRRKAIYGELKKDIGEILRKLCMQKGVDIIEAEACPDHIHIRTKLFKAFLEKKCNLQCEFTLTRVGCNTCCTCGGIFHCGFRCTGIFCFNIFLSATVTCVNEDFKSRKLPLFFCGRGNS